MALRSALTLRGEASALLRFATSLDGRCRSTISLGDFQKIPARVARSPKHSLTLGSLRSSCADEQLGLRHSDPGRGFGSACGARCRSSKIEHLASGNVPVNRDRAFALERLRSSTPTGPRAYAKALIELNAITHKTQCASAPHGSARKAIWDSASRGVIFKALVRSGSAWSQRHVVGDVNDPRPHVASTTMGDTLTPPSDVFA